MTTALEVGEGRHAPAAFYPRERPGTHCIRGVWAPGPVWTGTENLAPTGIRSPDRPPRSQSLYRLRYPENTDTVVLKKHTQSSERRLLKNNSS
jgi:hypothetical protein